jgi:hypothetical protein
MFRTVFDGNSAIPRPLPLATGQAIKAGDLVTLVSGQVQAKGTATDFCGVAAEDGAGSTILVYCEPAQLFDVAVSGRDALATDLGGGFAPGGASGDQTLDLTAAGNLRVVWLDPLALTQGSKVRVQIVDHQFSSNETDAERVPEPTTAGTWLRKVLAGVGSWVAGVPTITGTTGHLPKIKADGTLETSGIPAASVQVLTVPAAANNIAVLTAGGALADGGKGVAALMLRDTDGTAGDVCTLDANKDAAGSGLQLSRVARRPVSATTGNVCVFDANDDPVDGGALPVASDTSILPTRATVTDATGNIAVTDCVVWALAAAGDITLSLPADATIPLGKMVIVKNVGPPLGDDVIVSIAAGDLPTGPGGGIDENPTKVLTPMQSVTIVRIGAKRWAVV